MGQQQEIVAGNALVRRIILVLAVAAVMAAMVAAMAVPAFAKGPGEERCENIIRAAAERQNGGIPPVCVQR